MVLLVLIVEVWYLFDEDGFSLHVLCACGLVAVVVEVVVVAQCEEEEEEEEEGVLLLSDELEEVFVVDDDEAILCGEREDLVLLS